MTKVINLGRAKVPLSSITDLTAILTFMRPANSKAEAAFVKRFVAPLGTTPDAFGNHWLTIGTAPILWSCHTDTVHKASGTQAIEYGDGFITTSKGSCLGADDGAGVWLMSRMIQAKIPGTYVFHREEEIGGHGSAYVADQLACMLDGVKFAIAFDRRGTKDIITHQARGRTASDAFAASLADALGMGHVGCDMGSFTDTANYADIVPECTNLSVGYGREHTGDEYLDVVYLTTLLAKILSADFTGLECARDPARGDWEDDYRFWDHGAVTGSGGRVAYTSTREDMEDIIRRDPAGVAMFLKSCGYTETDLNEYLGDC